MKARCVAPRCPRPLYRNGLCRGHYLQNQRIFAEPVEEIPSEIVLPEQNPKVSVVTQKHRGALAEIVACEWLIRHGYEVFRNMSSHGIADFVAWKPGEAPLIIDVKSVQKTRRGDYFPRPSKEQSAAGVKMLHVDSVERKVYFRAENSLGFISQPETVNGNYDVPQGPQHNDADGGHPLV